MNARLDLLAYVLLALVVVVALYVAYAAVLGFAQMGLIEQLIVALGVLGWVHEIAPGLWAAAIAGAVSWGACTIIRRRAYRQGAIAALQAVGVHNLPDPHITDAMADEIAIELGALTDYLREESER